MGTSLQELFYSKIIIHRVNKMPVGMCLSKVFKYMLKSYPVNRSLTSFAVQRGQSYNWSCLDNPETETLVLLHVWFYNLSNIGFHALWEVWSNLGTHQCISATAMKKKCSKEIQVRQNLPNRCGINSEKHRKEKETQVRDFFFPFFKIGLMFKISQDINYS